MTRVRALLTAALLAACSRERADELAMTTNQPGAERPAQVVPIDPIGIRPIPAIPFAIQGCWNSVPDDDSDEPGGGPIRLIIGPARIEQSYPGGQPATATADFVERVTATSIEGRFSAPDGDGRMTIATSLILGPDDRLGVAAGELRVAEGDAGSYFLRRCGQQPQHALDTGVKSGT